MKRKWSFILMVLLFPWMLQVSGQLWMVPTEQVSVVNPSPYNLDNIKRGKELYTLNCKSCHGDPGKNNPLALVPSPVDIASETMHQNTQGAMFYKISNGRGVMPAFEVNISEDDRWKIVNFIMNYQPGGEVLLVEAPPIKAKLLASLNEEQAIVEILAESEDENQSFKNLSNVPVIVSAKKAFGNIEIGQALTNEYGRAEFKIPEQVIGDEEGYVSIVVSLNEDYVANAVTLDKARVGRLKEVPTLIKGEVLWSTNDNIQLWLLLSYIVAAGGAWSIIAYVIYQLIKIKRYSKESLDNVE